MILDAVPRFGTGPLDLIAASGTRTGVHVSAHHDRAPDPRPDNRAERRVPMGWHHIDMPWVGIIPNVGRSLPRLRACAGPIGRRRPGRRGSVRVRIVPAMRVRTPVRVDVVPVIHARAARGAWAARWSGARVLRSTATYAPTTSAGEPPARVLDVVRALILRTATGGPARDGTTPPVELATEITCEPTRGPCHRAGAPVAAMSMT